MHQFIKKIMQNEKNTCLFNVKVVKIVILNCADSNRLDIHVSGRGSGWKVAELHFSPRQMLILTVQIYQNHP